MNEPPRDEREEAGVTLVRMPADAGFDAEDTSLSMASAAGWGDNKGKKKRKLIVDDEDDALDDVHVDES